MEEEVTDLVGVERFERGDGRTGHRNGYRDRDWDTRAGTIALSVSRVRDGNYVPSIVECRRRAEKALISVVQEAYVHGVSTRKVDELDTDAAAAACTQPESSHRTRRRIGSRCGPL